MDTLIDVSALLRTRGDDLRREVHEHLCAAIPEARAVFSQDLSQAHLELPRALAWVFDRSQPGEPLSPQVRERVRALGRTHLVHGFPGDVYSVFASAFEQALSSIAGDEIPKERVGAASTIVREVCEEMAAAAREADAEHEPAAFGGRVATVRTPTPEAHVVQLECGIPPTYVPGDFLSVRPTHFAGHWLNLAPSVPPNKFGVLEFHVPATLQVTPGEQWLIGTPRHGCALSGDKNALFIVLGAGTAPVKALVFDALERGLTMDMQLVFAADSPAHLHDIFPFAALAAANEELTVTPCVEDLTNPAGTQGDPAGAAGLTPVTLPLTTIVAGPGMWWGREIIISAPDERIGQASEVREALLAAGADEHSIRILTPTPNDQWASSPV